jgi:arsenate reductase (thioredoxin)
MAVNWAWPAAEMMYPELQRTVGSILTDDRPLPGARMERLREIAAWIKDRLRRELPVDLVFVCTHNSRRSQFAQVWAATAAHFHALPITCWSAGTEVTQVALPVVDALEHAGFRIDGAGGFEDFDGHPRQQEYIINWDDTVDPVVLYSKSLDEPSNPSGGFAAIMVCAEADANCPFVPGADQRFSLPYRDPKESDGTDNESRTYRTRSIEIAREMFHLMELAAA